MKKRTYFVTAILAAMAVLSLSSCLKDPRYYTFANVGTLVELPLAAYYGTGNTVPEALPIQSTPQTIPVVVNVASPKPLSTPLNVTLAVDQAALDAYNTANGSSYTLPPANAYTISNFKVTVPAGQRQAQLQIQVISSNLDPAGAYILPLSITDASGQKISNYKTILLNIQAKNQYDGTYSMTGTVTRVNGGVPDVVLGGPYKAGLTTVLATTGANTVSFTQDWATGAEAGGVNPLQLAIDPSTNKVTVTSTINGTLANDPAYNNHYDPATKTFYLQYAWSTPGTRGATDTLTYVGPR